MSVQVYECVGCRYRAKDSWNRKPCPGCDRWFNIRQRLAHDDEEGEFGADVFGEVVSLKDAVAHSVEVPRLETGIEGWDWVLNGGFALGELVLLVGDPGTGKTMSLLNVVRNLAVRFVKCLYISGEETLDQLSSRAKPIGKIPSRVRILIESDLDLIFKKIAEEEPDFVVVDSINTLLCESGSGNELEPGSSASIKIAIREFMRFAKQSKTVFVIVGHLSKDGAIGGPQALNYFVDCSLYLRGNKYEKRRVLECGSKNRFGPTPRAAEFKVAEDGSGPQFVKILDEETMRSAVSEIVKSNKETEEAEKI